jgi:hypothetical protein
VSSNWSGPKSLEPYLARTTALAALAWFGTFSAIGVAFSMFQPEAGGFLAIGAVVVGVCGALVHASLLRLSWFLGLRSGRIIAVAVGTLALLALVLVAHNGAYGSSQGRSLADGVFEAVLFALLPVLVMTFFVTRFVERAGPA